MQAKMKKIVKWIYKCLIAGMIHVPYVGVIYKTKCTQTPVTLKMWFLQKILGFNRKAYWPVHFTSLVSSPERIKIGIETSPGMMPGCYIQGANGIEVGDYTQIASNVGLISANHDVSDNRHHVKTGKIVLGKYCWIGMNVVILPGVVLGDFTIVGAGSVVTKSFPEGYCVIAGNPAKKIKNIKEDDCIKHTSKFEYNGYIEHGKFENFWDKFGIMQESLS